MIPSYAIVIAASLLLYSNSLDGAFVFDDHVAIVGNRDVVGEPPASARDAWAQVAQIFRDDYWGTPLASDASHKSYRPLTVLSFRANALAARCGSAEALFSIERPAFHTAMAWIFIRVYCFAL